MEMILCPKCGTRFDIELRICPVCKAEVVPPPPKEQAGKKPVKPTRELAFPSLPDPTRNMRIVERPPIEGVLTGAVWSDVLMGLLAALLLPTIVGFSLYSTMSETGFSYLLAFLFM